MIKSYFRTNLKIDVTKNRIFWGISQLKLKSEIHSPDNFLLEILNAKPYASGVKAVKAQTVQFENQDMKLHTAGLLSQKCMMPSWP